MRKRENHGHSLNELFQEIGIDQHQEGVLDSKEVVDANKLAAAKLNILLSGEDAGIQLANRLADKLNIPFVLINSNGMNHSTAEASISIPDNYLNGSSQQILEALSKSLANEASQAIEKTEKKSPHQLTGSIFIKDNFNYLKVCFDEIDYVKSDGNYIEIHWANRVSVLKKTMKSFEEKASHHAFLQVHRSYLINLNKVTRIGPAHVYLDEHKIPLSKGKKDQLLEMLDTF